MALWSALVLSFLAASTRAQPADLVQQGVELRRLHEDARALELFEEAYRQDPRPSTLAQRGMAEQALGQWAQAYDHLREALRSDESWIEAQRATLEET